MYYFENGLRKVYPYFFEYQTHVKSRWVGRSLIDVFLNELGQDQDIVRKEITNNLIYIVDNFGRKEESKTIKGWPNLSDRIIHKNDIIYNIKHMHEPSVPHSILEKIQDTSIQKSTNIEIIFKDNELLVVNKPIGIPTHPTGSYKYNTLTEILKHDLQLHNIWPCHRLDQTTSGILILALNKQKCNEIVNLIENHKEKIQKYYFARVEGEFPEGELTYNCPIFSINTTGGYILQTNYQNLPKNSPTVFTRVKYNETLNQSIVLCKPITGRMHQIRIHLRNMGYPIVNDKYYNPKDDNSLESIINIKRCNIELRIYERIIAKEPQFKIQHGHFDQNFNRNECIDIFKFAELENDVEVRAALAEIKELRQRAIAEQKASFNKKCPQCSRELFNSDRDISKMDVWLHSFKYELLIDQNNPLSYETSPPIWCNI